VFIAGGIGITVFRCMLRYIVEEGLPHRVTLVYSNRDRESTAFLDELQAMDREHENISVVFVMTDDPEWEGEKRRVDADVLRDHLEGELGDYVHIAAGPPGMVDAMESALKGAGVPEEQVLVQRFAGY
jgi:ferredoxin-NADP reductase